MTLIVIFIALILLYGLMSRRLDRTILTAPIVFAGAGILVLLVVPSLREQQGSIEVFMTAAEVGLVLLLFNDASRIDRQVLKSTRTLPVRLLSVGMLLTILLGALGALVVFRQVSVLEGCILASIVLGLVYIEHMTQQDGLSTISLAVMATVFASIFAHGLSAVPGMELYASKIAELEPSAPEHEGG